MSTVYDNVRNDAYKSQLDYPVKPRKPLLAKDAKPADIRKHADAVEQHEADLITYRELRDAYNEDNNRLAAQFRKDLEEENGTTGHAKADLLYSKAYDMGHSSGFGEIANYYSDLAELVL